MPDFTQCHLPVSCNQAAALIPAVARLRLEESNLGGFRSCGAPGDCRGSLPRVHLDGMEQEAAGKGKSTRGRLPRPNGEGRDRQDGPDASVTSCGPTPAVRLGGARSDDCVI